MDILSGTEDTLSPGKDDGFWVSQQSKSIRYKPTPISELKKRHIPVSTTPNVIVSQPFRGNIERIQKPKAEYQPGSFNSYQTPIASMYKATKIEDSAKTSDEDQELLLNTILHKDDNEEYSLSQLGDDSEEEIDFDQISTAFNFLDEFLNDYDNKPKNVQTSKKFKKMENTTNLVIKDSYDSRFSQNKDLTNQASDQIVNMLIDHNEESLNKMEEDTRPPESDEMFSNKKESNESEKSNEITHKEIKEIDCSKQITKEIFVKANNSEERNNCKLSTHKKSSNTKIVSSSGKRTSEHLTENNKSVKKHKSNSDYREDKMLGENSENVTHLDKKKFKNENPVKKENEKNYNKTSKKDSTHRHSSSSSSKKDANSKSSSSKSSNKESYHKSSSNVSNDKESQYIKSSTKGSKERSVDSKKGPLNSNHEHYSNKTKEGSMSKKSSIRDSNTSSRHKENKHRKESNEKRKLEMCRKNQSDNDNNKGMDPAPKKKSKSWFLLLKLVIRLHANI